MGIVLLTLVLVGASLDTYHHYHDKKNATKNELTIALPENHDHDKTIQSTESKMLDSESKTQMSPN